MRSNAVCFIVCVMEENMLSSWLDLLLMLLCTNHTHVIRDWHEDESLEHGCRCIAAASVLLCTYCWADVVAATLIGSS